MRKILRGITGLCIATVLALTTSVSSLAYTVQPNDTLSKIAAATGTTVEELVQWNGIGDKNFIRVGQELITDKKEAGDKNAYKRVELTEAEKKAILSLFDPEYYANANPDVVDKYGTATKKLQEHFLTYGLWETRQPNEEFNVNAYASAYDDLYNAFKSDNLGKQITDLYLHYVDKGKEEGRVTTIEECLDRGRNVLYFGAYDNETEPTAQEHIIASVPEPEPAPEAPAEPAPVGYSSFEEACNYFVHDVIVRLKGLYDKYIPLMLPGNDIPLIYEKYVEYAAMEVTTANMSAWLSECNDDPSYFVFLASNEIEPDEGEEFADINNEYAYRAAQFFFDSLNQGYSDLDVADFGDLPLGNLDQAHIEQLEEFFLTGDNFDQFYNDMNAHMYTDDSWFQSCAPVDFVLGLTIEEFYILFGSN